MPEQLAMLLGETRTRLLVCLRRRAQTITELSAAVGLTDNAVRTHIAALERDGLVAAAEMQRGTGGKPARMYRVTAQGDELFPKAYAVIMDALLAELDRDGGRERVLALLRAVGKRVAGDVAPTAGLEAGVEAAAGALRALGGDVEVQRTEAGWRLEGFACPLSALTGTRPELCVLAQTLVGEITGRLVTECCDRSDRPRCGFLVPGVA